MRKKTLKMLGVPLLAVMLLSGCFGKDSPEEQDKTSEYDVNTENLPEMENPPNPDTLSIKRPSGELGRYSADELTGAHSIASEYVVASLTTPELLSGQWWQEGHDMDTLADLGKFSDSLQDDIRNLNPEDGVGAQATQSVALFLTETDTITSTLECKTEGECSGDPFYGEPTWSSVNEDVVSLEVSASVVRPVVKNDSEVNSLDTYNYLIHMSEDDGEWIINQIQNSYTIGKEAV